MALAEFLAELDQLAAAAQAAFGAATDADALEAARVDFLGAKSGRLKAVQKGLGGLTSDEKPAGGKRFNEIKNQIEAAFTAAKERQAGGVPPRPAIGNRSIGPCRAAGRGWAACIR